MFDYVKLAIVVSIFAAGAWLSYMVMSGKAARQELAYERERTVAAEALATAQAETRAIEGAWRADVAAKEAAYREATVTRESRISALNATNSKLSERIATLSRSSNPSADSATAIHNLQQRAETLGTLLGELDAMAGESARTADTLRDELDLCRQYTQVLQ